MDKDLERVNYDYAVDPETGKPILPNPMKLYNPYYKKKNALIYNPDFYSNQEELVQNLSLDMLHGLSKDSPQYKYLRGDVKNKLISGDLKNAVDRHYQMDIERGHFDPKYDNFERDWFNPYADGVIRQALFEGTPEQFKKYRYDPEAKQVLLSNKYDVGTPLKQIYHHLQYPHGLMMPEVEVTAERIKRNGGLIKAQEGLTGESLEDKLTPNVSKEKAYLKNTYQSDPYKQRLLNEVTESLKMPNRYRYKDPETVTDYLIDARVKNLDETKVLPSISFEEGVPSASDVFRQIKPSQGTYLGLALPQYGDIRIAKFQDKDLYFPMSRNPIIAFNPNKYGLQYNESPKGLLKLSDAAIEEQEHASHFATPFSGVDSPRMLESGQAYEEANNITNFARNIIKQNATDDPYLGKPTEAIAAKRRVEHMLSNLPKGTLSTPFEYGQMMTDEHFNFVLEKAKQGEPNSVRMMQTLMGPDAEKMLKGSISPESLNKFKQSFKNIMDKIAMQSNNLPNSFG